MKKSLFLLLPLLCCHLALAQDEVNFEFADGIRGPLKTKMEQQATRLLTAINRACATSSDINFSGIQFEQSQEATMTLAALWNSVHFCTQDDDIYEPCLQLKQGSSLSGYQVRNVYMEMMPVDDSYQDDPVQEFVINFDAQGRISNVNIAMGKLQYQELMQAGEQLNDIDHRLQIINFCEQFANAYNKMDMNFLEDIFSEDALIITGSVRQRQPATISARVNPETGERMPNQPEVVYTSQTKQQYLNKLRGIFNRQKNQPGGYIKVEFSDYEIVRHGAAGKQNYYGVTLRQKWSTKGYSDEGVVFLVWNFADEEHPKIEVRTWQPTWAKKRYTLGSFRLR